MAQKHEHDMVGDTQVFVSTTHLAHQLFRIEVKWDPADRLAPNKLDFTAKNCKSHDKAGYIGFKEAARVLGTTYEDPLAKVNHPDTATQHPE